MFLKCFPEYLKIATHAFYYTIVRTHSMEHPLIAQSPYIDCTRMIFYGDRHPHGPSQQQCPVTPQHSPRSST
ncbi:hypothetical protein I7I48_11034 [Histoplasma ohiense]|nr:hypothetical protein I7I48_11034 [Histoplasma ohiense (nom. inval.)]